MYTSRADVELWQSEAGAIAGQSKPRRRVSLIPLLGDLEQRCRIKAVWRRDGEVGGAFLSIGGLAADGDDRVLRPAGKRLASVKETGEEIPQGEWERFEAARKKPRKR